MTLHFSTGRPFAALALAAAGLVGAGQAGAVPLLGLTTTNGLVTFDSATPGTGSPVTAISGLAAGERILDIDLRPTTGVIYGLSSASRVYSLNSSGTATFVGALSTSISGSFASIDFNPVADLGGMASLRIVTSSGQNYAYNVNAATTTEQTALSSSNNISTVAYSNNDIDPATATALYYIDETANTLKVATTGFGNPTITTVGPLGFDVTGAGGFEIVGASTAFAALSAGPNGLRNGLYAIDLSTGGASYVGAFAGGVQLQGLTSVMAPIPEPSTYALLAIGLAGVGFVARRRRAG